MKEKILALLTALATSTTFAATKTDSLVIQVGIENQAFENQGNIKSMHFWGYSNTPGMEQGSLLNTTIPHPIHTLSWIKYTYHNTPDYCAVQFAISGNSSNEIDYISSIKKILFAQEDFTINNVQGDFFSGSLGNLSVLINQQLDCTIINTLEQNFTAGATIEISVIRDEP